MPGPHKWQHKIQGHGSRWTVPRRAVLNLLSRTSKHMSAKEIYSSLHRMYPGIGLTTVYRTLDLLVRMGLLHKFAFGTGESRYEYRSDTKETHHHHLICTQCGKIVDYTDFVDEELELIKKTEKSLTTKHNFCITDHNIEFYGLCAKCKS
ncbi:MAG: transcriptional repressor [Candidatus Aminicenantes bacterium]|nr:transcriptional repressor [Candidatus Aminicenantes bacterium]